jgi:hypothetical protein
VRGVHKNGHPALTNACSQSLSPHDKNTKANHSRLSAGDRMVVAGSRMTGSNSIGRVKFMADKELDATAFSALRLAVGSLEHLRLVHAEYLEVLHTLAWFVGGSLEGVELLSDVPGTSVDEHHVYWLRGKTIGCLVVGAHQGPEGDHGAKLLLNGYVRPLSDVVRLELQDMEIVWPWGENRAPEIRPTMVIHFADDELTVDVASRTSELARAQAIAFIDRLQATLATA